MGIPVSRAVRDDVATLAAIDRDSASSGEHEAALALKAMFERRGLGAVLERERSVGGFWRPVGLAAGAGAAAGLLGRRHRRLGAALAALAAALMADDVDGGPHLLRRLLPRRETSNVLARAGNPAARRRIVLVAHHDAGRAGLVFHPGPLDLIVRLAPGWYEGQQTSVQSGRLLVAGPALAAAGCALGNRALRRFGVLWSAITAALMADVARAPVVPGANDNLSAVGVLLALAEALATGSCEDAEVLLLSTGSEETFMEGMRGFIRRHRDELDPAETLVVAIECVGSPHLILLEGEGMLVMRDYDDRLREQLQQAADEAGQALWRGLRLGAGATDAHPALRAGYRSACLAGCTDLKVPSNYHRLSDTIENLDWSTIESAAAVLGRLLRIEPAAQPATDTIGRAEDGGVPNHRPPLRGT